MQFLKKNLIFIYEIVIHIAQLIETSLGNVAENFIKKYFVIFEKLHFSVAVRSFAAPCTESAWPVMNDNRLSALSSSETEINTTK